MSVKIIGLDIDGTLLTPERTISPRTVAALSAAAAMGVHIVPVTGRPLSGLPAALSELHSIDYAITSNGASVWHYGALTMQHRFPSDVCAELLRRLDGMYSLAEVFIDGFGYLPQKTFDHFVEKNKAVPFVEYFKQSRRGVPDIYAFLEVQSSVEEIAVMFRSVESCEKALEILADFSMLKAARPMANYLEIMSADGGKGTSLNKLGALLGVTPDEIMAIGDSDNDADMLKKIGIPIAMGNAAESLKQIACFVTADNANDGIALAVEKFVLNPGEIK